MVDPLKQNGQRMMSKNLWNKERQQIYRTLLKGYKEEGYDHAEAITLAKKEVDEVMSTRTELVDHIWDETYEE